MRVALYQIHFKAGKASLKASVYFTSTEKFQLVLIFVSRILKAKIIREDCKLDMASWVKPGLLGQVQAHKSKTK